MHGFILQKTASILPGIYEFPNWTTASSDNWRQQQFPRNSEPVFWDIPIVVGGAILQNNVVFFSVFAGSFPGASQPHLAKPDPVPIASLTPMQFRWCWRTRSSGVLPRGTIGLNLNHMYAYICVCQNATLCILQVPNGIHLGPRIT
mgnify:CR=1 FL=1